MFILLLFTVCLPWQGETQGSLTRGLSVCPAIRLSSYHSLRYWQVTSNTHVPFTSDVSPVRYTMKNEHWLSLPIEIIMAIYSGPV